MSTPYAPPASDSVRLQAQLGEFKLADPRFLIGAVYLSVVANLVSNGADLGGALLVPDWTSGNLDSAGPVGWVLLGLMLMGGLASLGMLLVTGLLFWIWIHRANRNVRALGAADMVYTPGWCVGWWFIPFANLFKPPKTVMEVFKASNPESDSFNWKNEKDASLVTNWWTSWLFGNILGNVSMRASNSENIDFANLGPWIGLLSTVALVFAGISLVKIIRQVQARQWAKAHAAANPTPDATAP